MKRIRTIAVCVASAAALVAAFAGPAAATPGTLDPTFGTAGLVRTDVTPRGDGIYGEAIQPDDKIVVVGPVGGGGPNPKFGVARYMPNGTPDPSFGGGDGIVQTDIGPRTDLAVATVVQGDGKIVVVGFVGSGGPDPKFGIVRYMPNGTPDPSFGGGDGIVTVNVSTREDDAEGVGLLSDGTIIVAGTTGRDTSNSNFAAVALNGTDGSLNTAFGGTGIVRTDVNSGSYDVGYSNVVVHNNEIYVGGWTFKAEVSRFAVVSYNADGTPNTAFGGVGRVATNVTPGYDYIDAMAVDGLGNIVAVGAGNNNLKNSEAAIVRYTPSGDVDTSFNATGIALTNYGPYGDAAMGVTIDGSGNIVTAGEVGYGGANPRFAVCRYVSTGTLDSVFGTSGKVFTDFNTSHEDSADFVGIQSTGRIVAAGSAGLRSGNSKFALAGYQSS